VRRNGGVMLIHRPKYDDWSFPKGKLEQGESFEECAAREVEEESGWVCDMGPELEPSHYTDDKGRAKEVRWFEMWARERRSWEPNDEVDDVVWIPLSEAESFLTHETDRQLAAKVRAAGRTRPAVP